MNFEAYRRLLKIANIRKNDDDFKELTGKILKLGKFDNRLLLLLGESYFETEEYDKMALILNKIGPDSPQYGTARYRLGEKYCKLKNYENATNFLLSGLKNITDPAELDRIYQTVCDLFSDGERGEYKRLPVDKKGAYMADFWRRQDPDIFTPANERLLEHVRRADYARKVFSKPGRDQYDGRGRIYVRYGEPEYRYASGQTASYGSQSTNIKGAETWIYPSIDPRLYYDFIEYSPGIFRYDRNLSKVLVSNSDNIYPLMKERESMLGSTYMTMERDIAIANSPRDMFILKSNYDLFIPIINPVQIRGGRRQNRSQSGIWLDGQSSAG